MQIKIKFKFDIEEGKVKMKIKKGSSKFDKVLDSFYKNGKEKGFTKSSLKTFLYAELALYIVDTEVESYIELIDDQEIKKESLKESTINIDSDKFIESLNNLSKKIF